MKWKDTEEGKNWCKVYGKEYRKKNSSKNNEYQKQYREENKQELLDKKKEYYQLHKEEHKRIKKEYRDNNKERIKEYYQTPRAKILCCIKDGKRKARKLNQLGPNPPTIEFLEKLYSSRCWYCGEAAKHADHFYPLSKGGLHDISNLVPACAFCNLSKNDKDPYVFCAELLTQTIETSNVG
jgi:5-methylcytosine-specific restriction endonuclease McrA